MSGSSSILITPMERKDWSYLADIEASAAQLFAHSPYPELAKSIACTQPFLDQHFKAGGLGWSAKDQEGQVVGFLVAHGVEGMLHIDELSVRAAYQKRGIGSALLTQCLDVARAGSYHSVSLTTYADITWNEPFYARWGFHISAPDERPKWLSDCLEREIRSGANPQTRVAMMITL